MSKVIEHLKSDWYKYLLEILVIILSILLAFWLNNWSEGLKDQKRKKELISNLRSELQIFKDELASAGSWNKSHALTLDTFILHYENLDHFHADRKIRIFRSTMSHSDITPDIRSLDNALSSEGSKLLNDKDLLDQLFDLKSEFQDLIINNQYLIEYWNNRISPTLIETGHMVDFQKMAAGRGIDLDHIGALFKNQRYVNVMAGKAVLQRDLGNHQLRLVDMIDELLKRMNQD